MFYACLHVAIKAINNLSASCCNNAAPWFYPSFGKLDVDGFSGKAKCQNSVSIALS